MSERKKAMQNTWQQPIIKTEGMTRNDLIQYCFNLVLRTEKPMTSKEKTAYKAEIDRVKKVLGIKRLGEVATANPNSTITIK